MKKIKRKHVIVIGTTHLCIACLQMLIKHEYVISLLVSDDCTVQTWASQQKIKFRSVAEFIKAPASSADYLFSIVNPAVIPISAIQQSIKKLAINYHNSLLPSYAGANSTMWALFNGEKSHGVTWHVMTQQIDAGDILLQRSVDIASTDTVFELNYRCTQAALDSFEELLTRLDSEALQPMPQDLSKRTYYNPQAIPDNMGIINPAEPAAKINNTLRALSYKTQINPVTSLKVVIEGVLYLVGTYERKSELVTKTTGTISNAMTDSIDVVIGEHVIELHDLQSLQGEAIDCRKFADKQLDPIDQPLCENLAKQLQHAKAHESKMIKRIGRYSYFLKGQGRGQINLEYQHLEKDFLYDPVKLMTCLIAFLLRVKYDQDTLAVIYDNQLHQTQIAQNPLLTQQIPWLVPARQLDNTLLEFNAMTQQELNSSLVYASDLWQRQQLERINQAATIKICLSNDATTADLDDEYALSIVVAPQGIKSLGQVGVELTFIKSLVNGALHFYQLINKQQSIKALNLLSPTDYKQVIYQFNETQQAFNNIATITDCVTENAKQYPNQLAVQCDQQSLTFSELEHCANRLSSLLIHEFLAGDYQQPGVVVLHMQASAVAIAAMLAIFKSPFIYVPMDINLPLERKQFIVDDAGVALIIASRATVDSLQLIQKAKILCIEDMLDHAEVTQPQTLPKSEVAYILYTSGTTGQPKGVEVYHYNLVNFLLARKTELQARYQDKLQRFFLYVELFFDPSLQIIFLPLIYPGTLVIPNAAEKQVNQMTASLQRHKINFVNLPASIFNRMPQRYTKKMSLQVIQVGAEVANDDALRFWLQHIDIINAYGPTEVTICCTVNYFAASQFKKNCIGRPIANTFVYVLDDNLQPLPIGNIGRIYVGGLGIAKGYLHRDDLTQQRFINNPFVTSSDTKLQRMYDTGDLGRWTATGALEFFGRSDAQIKVRGIRIEPGEVRAALLQHPEITDCVVFLATVQQRQYFTAYYLAEKSLNDAKLRDFLAQRVARYIIPDRFIHVDSFPLTANGKLDYKKLQTIQYAANQQFEAPDSWLQDKLVAIYEEVTGMEKVSVTDSFFAIGGDSINLIHLIAKAQACSIQLNPSDVYQYPDIKTLSQHVVVDTDGAHEELVNEGVYFPLSPIQCWFFASSIKNKNQWVQEASFEVAQSLSTEMVVKMIKALLDLHPELRMEFSQAANDSIKQKYVGVNEVEIGVHYNQQQLLFKNGVLVPCNQAYQINIQAHRFVLIKVNTHAAGTRLAMVIHHLLVDYVSWVILLDDLRKVIAQSSLGKRTALYRHWVQVLSDYSANIPKSHYHYWSQMVARINANNIYQYRVLQKNKSHHGKYHQQVTVPVIKPLLAMVNQRVANIGEIALMMMALSQAIAALLQTTTVQFVYEQAGRFHGLFEQVNLSRSVGWFTAFYPLVINASQSTAEDLLIHIAEEIKSVPAVGASYLILEYYQKIFKLNKRHCVALNYAKDIVDLQTGEAMQITSKMPANEELFSPLEIDIFRRDESFEFEIRYDKRYLSEACVQQLLNDFQHGLQDFYAQLQQQTLLKTMCHPSQCRFLKHNPIYRDVYAAIILYQVKREMDIEILQAKLQQILSHPLFSATINLDDDAMQFVKQRDPQQYDVPINHRAKNLSAIKKAMQSKARDLKIDQRLWDIVLQRERSGNYMLGLVLHHLLFDRDSVNVLMKKIEAACHSAEAKVDTHAFDHYFSFVHELWLRRHSIVMNDAVEYWQQMLSGAESMFAGPNAVDREQMQDMRLVLSDDIKLMNFYHPQYTLFHLTLYAFYQSLCDFYQAQKPLVSVILNGNSCGFVDSFVSLANSFGWKSITVPFALQRNDLSLDNVAKIFNSMPLNGHSYGVLKYLNQIEFPPDTDIEFNFQQQRQEQLSLFEPIATDFIYDGRDTPEFRVYFYIMATQSNVQVNCHYSPVALSKEQLATFLKQFQQRFNQVLNELV